MSDLRISIAHVVLTMESGGLESVVYDLCRNTDKKKFRPEIICLQKCDERYHNLLQELEIPVTIIKKKFKFDIGYFFRVSQFLKQRKIQIVHAHSGCFFYAALFFLLARCKRLIYTAHGLPILNRLQDKVEDNIAALLCYRIVAVSAEIESHLKDRLPFAKKKISLILNGIDTDKYKPFKSIEQKADLRRQYHVPEDSFLVGTVGRLAPEKNYPMLLKAFLGFNVLAPEISKHLIFVGDGQERTSLEKMTAQLGLEDMVTFTGNQNHIQNILPMFDVFALSSITEGTSISLLEAQACGISAVATDVGGNSNVIKDKYTGYLCPLNDNIEMAQCFQKIFDEPRSFRGNARVHILEKFSLSKTIDKYEKIYSEVH